MHKKIIVAIDFGSDAIKAVVAEKQASDSLRILTVKTIPSEGCILRGRIYNLEEAHKKLNQLLATLNSYCEIEITQFYTTVCGQSAHTIPQLITRQVEAGEVVSQELLDEMMQEALETQIDGYTVVSALSPKYTLDDRLESNPRGVACTKIEASYQLLLARPALTKSIDNIAAKNQVQVAQYLPAIEALSELVFTPTEKETATLLVDMGAETTELALYNRGLLESLLTLPLGSTAITKDLCSLNISYDEAEELKIKHGLLNKEENTEAHHILSARLDEILANIVEFTKDPTTGETLFDNVVLAGGGSQLKGLVQEAEKKFKAKVRLASIQNTNLVEKAGLSPSCYTLLGILALSTETCATAIITEEVQKEPEQGNIFPNSESAPKKVEAPKAKVKKEPKTRGMFGAISRTLSSRLDQLSNDIFDNH